MWTEKQAIISSELLDEGYFFASKLGMTPRFIFFPLLLFKNSCFICLKFFLSIVATKTD